MANYDLHVFEDPPALAEAAAQLFIQAAGEAIARQGRFSAALSGGSTPRAVYARLAQPELSAQVDWSNVHLFWGDERCVPPEHPDSSFGMAQEIWLRHVPIPEDNLHRLHGELPPSQAADLYEAELNRFFAEGQPAFDLALLGMGADGHTASLFPGNTEVQASQRLCQAVYVEKLSAWRLTLTPRVFNAAQRVLFLVSGLEKAETLQQVLDGPFQPERLPAQSIRPEGGVRWYVDRAAAGGSQEMVASDQ